MTPVQLLAVGVLVVLAYAALWAAFMMSPARRSFRSVAYLIVTSLFIPAAALSDYPFGLVLATAAASAWAAGLWDLNHVLAPMEPNEVRFDLALSRVWRTVSEARKRVKADQWEHDRVSHLGTLDRAIAETTALQPPTSEWDSLRNLVLRALEFEAATFRWETRGQ